MLCKILHGIKGKVVVNMEKPLKRGMPSLKKILLFMLLLAFTIAVFGVLLLLYSYHASQKISDEKTDSILKEQLEIVHKRITTTNYYLVETLQNSSQIKNIEALEDTHRVNVEIRSLYSELAYQRNYWAKDFSFFFWNSEKSTGTAYFSTEVSYAQNQSMKEYLQHQFASFGFPKSSRWGCVLLDEIPYLFQCYSEGENHITGWISCNTLLRDLQDTALTERGGYRLINADLAELYTSGGDQRKSSFRKEYELPGTTLSLQVFDTPYIDRTNTTTLIFILTTVFFTLLIFCLYTLIYFKRHIEDPLKRFQDHIAEYSSYRAENTRKGFVELNEAVNAFDSLEKQFQTLKIDYYEKELDLAKTRLEFYQLQIKPHFFLNCFSILFSMAQNEETERIQFFCMKLSHYVRYLFSNGFSLLPLETELSMVQEFLDIQNIRQRTEIPLDLHMAKNAGQYLVPPLLIITFVENSIKYAEVEKSALTLSLSISQTEKGELSILIRDNGKGFSAEQLDLFNQRNQLFPDTENRCIGIRNICKRLSLLYGENFSLTFRNRSPGAEVEVRVPCFENEIGISEKA